MADEFISNEFIYDSSDPDDTKSFETKTASEATKAYAGSHLTSSDVGKFSGEVPVPDNPDVHHHFVRTVINKGERTTGTTHSIVTDPSNHRASFTLLSQEGKTRFLKPTTEQQLADSQRQIQLNEQAQNERFSQILDILKRKREFSPTDREVNKRPRKHFSLPPHFL